MVGFALLFYCLCAVLFCLTFFSSSLLPLTALVFCLKMVGELLLMVPGLRRFGHKNLIPLLPFASLLQLPLVLSAVLIGIFGRFTWKDQSFRRTIH